MRIRWQNAKASYSYCVSNSFTPVGPRRQFKRTKHNEVSICYSQYFFFSFLVILNVCFRQQRNMDAEAGKGWKELRVPLCTPAKRAASHCDSKQLPHRKSQLNDSPQSVNKHICKYRQYLWVCVCVSSVKKPWWKYRSNHVKLPFS